MANKTGLKYSTDLCGRCGEPHFGYSGKLDSNGIEYVICGVTVKRMNINGIEANSFAFPTKWIRENNSN